MIAWIEGILLEKEPPKLVINVQGVGYDIETSMNTFFNLPSIGEQCHLHIHTVIREDAFLLFGFSETIERQLFRQIVKVNGVGPKLALSILSTLSPQLLIQCIHSQDVPSLIKVPGVGKKTAERMMIDLKDLPTSAPSFLDKSLDSASHELSSQQEAISALQALGYKNNEASKFIKSLDASLSCEEMIREALKTL